MSKTAIIAVISGIVMIVLPEGPFIPVHPAAAVFTALAWFSVFAFFGKMPSSTKVYIALSLLPFVSRFVSAYTAGGAADTLSFAACASAGIASGWLARDSGETVQAAAFCATVFASFLLYALAGPEYACAGGTTLSVFTLYFRAKEAAA